MLFFCLTGLYDNQNFNVTNYQIWKWMDIWMKSDQFVHQTVLSFTPSDVPSSPAFSNVSILNMNHLFYPLHVFLFPPFYCLCLFVFCLVRHCVRAALWFVPDMFPLSFSFLILSNSNQYFLPCSCLLSSYIVSSHLL